MSKAQELKPELLPCPMCGGTEILVKKRKTTMVECKACGLVVFNYQDGIERDAIAHWNTRAPASIDHQGRDSLAEERIWELKDASNVPHRVPEYSTDCWGDEKTTWRETQTFSFMKFARLIESEHGIAARASNGGKAND